MPHHHVSNDLKSRIPYLIYVEGFKVKEVGCLLGVKKSMIYQTLNYFRDYDVTHNPNAYSHNRGRHRKLDSIDIQVIKALLDQELCLYLDELQDLLLTRRHLTVNTSSVASSDPFFSQRCLNPSIGTE